MASLSSSSTGRRGSVNGGTNTGTTTTVLEPLAAPWSMAKKEERAEMLAALSEALKAQKIVPTAAELKSPTPEVAQRLLGGLVRRAVGQDWDFSTPHFDGNVALQAAPQLFDDAVPDINLYQAIVRICQASGQPRVSFGDILKPTREKIFGLCASVVNYLRFVEDFQMLQKECDAKLHHMLQQRDTNEGDIKALEGTLAEVRQEHDQRKEVVNKVDEETARLDDKLNIIENEWKEISNESAKKKEEIQLIRTKTNDVKAELTKAIAEVQQLQQLVVPDPERTRKEIAEMEASLISGAAEIDDHNSRLRASQTKLAQLTQVQTKIDSRIAIMREIATMLQQQKQFDQELKSNSERNAEEETKLNQLLEREAADRAELDKLSAKLTSNQEEFKTKREISFARLGDAHQRRDAATHNQAREKQATEKTQLAIAARTRELDDVKLRHTNMMDDVQSKYDILQRQVMTYHRTMMDALSRAGMNMDQSSSIATHLYPINTINTSGATTATPSSKLPLTLTPSAASSSSMASATSLASSMSANTPILSSKHAAVIASTMSGGAATVTMNAFESDEKRVPIYE